MNRCHSFAATIVVLATTIIVGCMSVGRPFAVEDVPRIRIGTHTQADIEGLFGPPWRTGIEDGQKTWTYGDYKWSVGRQTRTRDLVVRFDRNGVVTSYSFSSDQPEDAKLEAPPASDF